LFDTCAEPLVAEPLVAEPLVAEPLVAGPNTHALGTAQLAVKGPVKTFPASRRTHCQIPKCLCHI